MNSARATVARVTAAQAKMVVAKVRLRKLGILLSFWETAAAAASRDLWVIGVLNEDLVRGHSTGT